MSSVRNLVAGRLSRHLPPSLSGQTRPPLTVTGYDVSRLGLVRPEAAQAEQPQQPAATNPHLYDDVSRLGLVRPEAAQAEQPQQPAATHPRLRDDVPLKPEAAQAEQPRQPAATNPRLHDGVPLKKVTASLALPQANRLKAYCGAAGRFQYAVIGAAIYRYLLEVVGQLDDAQKDEMVEIAASLYGVAVPTEADTHAVPVVAAPAGPDGDGAIAAPLEGLRPATAPADTADHSYRWLAGIFGRLSPRSW
jgi:hypothetical protein